MTLDSRSRHRLANAPLVPPLGRGVCQVWWADRSDAHPALDALLTASDLERRARLRRPADRERTTVATALARSVLAALAHGAPGGLDVDRTCRHCGEQHGKPWVPEHPDLHFSVSHSGDCVVVAVRRDQAVGVDVEEVAPWAAADLDDVAELTLSPQERAVLAAQRVADRALAFTTLWTRKEAAVKATGAGLTVPLDEIVVSSPGCPPKILRWAGGTPPVLHTLAAPSGFVGALATDGAGPTAIAEIDAGPLLRSAGA